MKKFKAELIETLENMCPEYDLTSTSVFKLNDRKLEGIMVRKDGEDLDRIIYIGDAYGRYKTGKVTIKDLAEEIAKAIAEDVDPPVAPPEITEETIKESIATTLVDTTKNVEFLKTVPYKNVGNGLALLFSIRIKSNDYICQARITNEMGFDVDTLYKLATETEPVRMPAKICLWSDMINGTVTDLAKMDKTELEETLRRDPIYFGNEEGTFGAASLFYPYMQKMLADLVGGSYYVLPSSLHEVMVIPKKSASMSVSEMKTMVVKANRYWVEPEDVLSDNIFFYDAEEEMLTIAA